MAKNDAKNKFLEVKARGDVLIFAFGDGVKLEFDPNEANDDIRHHAMLHGFNQKIRDAAAGFSKESDYAGAREQMDAVITGLYNGEWNRKGGAGAGVILTDLATAIAELRNVTFEQAMMVVEAADDEKRKGWAKNAKVAARMAELKAERLNRAAEAATDDDLPTFDEEE